MYANVSDVQDGFRELDEKEIAVCSALIKEASIIIDSYKSNATDEQKNVVVCRMVRRAIGNNDSMMPIGANQGTVSALGYSQTFTMSNNGSVGELYISRTEKKLLGVADKLGSRSILEGMV